MTKAGISSISADGTVWTKKKNSCPSSAYPLEAYTFILSQERIERLQKE